MLYVLCVCLAMGVIDARISFSDARYSDNFVTKWEFFSLSSFGFDPQTDSAMFALSTHPGGLAFNPRDVRAGDCIFVRGRNVDDFFKEYDPLIKQPYIVICHGEYKDAFKESYL